MGSDQIVFVSIIYALGFIKRPVAIKSSLGLNNINLSPHTYSTDIILKLYLSSKNDYGIPFLCAPPSP